MKKSKPKIGERVRWTSLDDTVPTTYGTITEVSPSGNRVDILWDDGEESTADLTNRASGVRLMSEG